MAQRRKKSTVVLKAAPAQVLGPLDITRLREDIQRVVGNEALAMVTSTIEGAKKGRYLAMRFLFEMAGIYPASTAEAAPSGEESLAQTLLERLGLLSPDELQGADSHESAGSARAERDAVK